jgi:hypothetical protein
MAISIVGENTRIIPGHGVLATRAELVEVRDSLMLVRDRIAMGISEGKTLNEVVRADPTRGLEWSSPRLMTLEKLVEWIYLELSEARGN